MSLNFLSVIALLGLVAIVSCEINPIREVKKNKFGALEVVDSIVDRIEKTVYLPSKDFLKDYSR